MNTNIIYFHGRKKGEPLKQPSLIRPFYITDDFDFAKEYSAYFDPVIFILTLKQDVRCFNFCKGEDIPKLKGGKSIYSDRTLDMMTDLYQNDAFTFWWATHDGMYKSMDILRECFDLLDKDEYFGISFLTNDIHHSRVQNASPIDSTQMETAKKIQKLIREKTGFKSISEYVFSENLLEKVNNAIDPDGTIYPILKFQISVAAVMLDALANGRYTFDFLSYRRPIYKAILEMGYTVTHDNDTDQSGREEYAILDGSAVDKVLNTPLFDKENAYDKDGHLLTELGKKLRGKIAVTIDEFLSMLKECKQKTRKLNFRP